MRSTVVRRRLGEPWSIGVRSVDGEGRVVCATDAGRLATTSRVADNENLEQVQV